MTTTTRSTELESVNVILSTIGESPLNSLSGSLPVDGTVAKNVLSEISREVQSAGWHFNTHHKASLSKDTNNKIPLGTNVLRVELNPYKYSKTDSNAHIKNVAIASNVICDSIDSNPSFAIKLCSL